MAILNRNKNTKQSDILWLDLGEYNALVTKRDPQGKWQDHGLGLLRTILHQNGIYTDVASTRSVSSLEKLSPYLSGYKILLMNVRSYTFPIAVDVSRLFKKLNPNGLVIVGGMHATVALDEMEVIETFDKICKGPGENIISELVKNPELFPRIFEGDGAQSLADWPMIDRSLWPNPPGHRASQRMNWPLEPSCGWGPAPVATVITSRVCPWQCSFCNESSFIPKMGRRPVDMVIDELNHLDDTYGVGSVVIHDSMFFQNPKWLEEWLEKYPKRANKVWPYWAAGRPDTVRKWPELFEALVRETNWRTISIGFESGSDRMLKILNKECTEDDNLFTIDLVNRLGDEMVAEGKEPPSFWTNIIVGIPGESREDAFKTMSMVKRIKRGTPSIAYYAPYPGSILGYQLIAEGKSLMSKENYHRSPGVEKLKGIDYPFYHDLLAGKFDPDTKPRKNKLGRLLDSIGL